MKNQATTIETTPMECDIQREISSPNCPRCAAGRFNTCRETMASLDRTIHSGDVYSYKCLSCSAKCVYGDLPQTIMVGDHVVFCNKTCFDAYLKRYLSRGR